MKTVNSTSVIQFVIMTADENVVTLLNNKGCYVFILQRVGTQNCFANFFFFLLLSCHLTHKVSKYLSLNWKDVEVCLGGEYKYPKLKYPECKCYKLEEHLGRAALID